MVSIIEKNDEIFKIFPNNAYLMSYINEIGSSDFPYLSITRTT